MPAQRERQLPEKVDLNLTPMIDVVFQLLTFFLLTLRIVPDEGEFQIQLPIAAAESRVLIDDHLPPLRVRLVAGASGELARVEYNGQTLSGPEPIAELHRRVTSYVAAAGVAADRRNLPEIELECDPALKYEYAVQALTAVSGERRGDQITPLLDKVRFAPRKK